MQACTEKPIHFSYNTCMSYFTYTLSIYSNIAVLILVEEFSPPGVKIAYSLPKTLSTPGEYFTVPERLSNYDFTF